MAVKTIFHHTNYIIHHSFIFNCPHWPKKNICFTIKIKSLCDIGAKLWQKYDFHMCAGEHLGFLLSQFCPPSMPVWHTFYLWSVDHNDPQTAIQYCICLNGMFPDK